MEHREPLAEVDGEGHHLFPGTIRSPQVVEFLTHLLRHIPGEVLVIWDRLLRHRRRLVREFVRPARSADPRVPVPNYAQKVPIPQRGVVRVFAVSE